MGAVEKPRRTATEAVEHYKRVGNRLLGRHKGDYGSELIFWTVVFAVGLTIVLYSGKYKGLTRFVLGFLMTAWVLLAFPQVIVFPMELFGMRVDPDSFMETVGVDKKNRL